MDQQLLFFQNFLVNLQTKKSEHISSLMMMESPPFQTFKQINDFLVDQLWEMAADVMTRHDTIAITTNHSSYRDLWDGITMLAACHPGDNEDFHTQWQPLSAPAPALPPYRSGHCVVWRPEIMNIQPGWPLYTTQAHPPQHTASQSTLFFLFFINVSQIGQITFDYPLFNQKITNEKKTN